MKRLFTYILALSLLPQIASASVLVGKTEGTFAVSSYGSATYTIPIKVQDGLSKFSPSISLTYDSRSGNGIVGMGFSISGIPIISAVPRSARFDGWMEDIQPGADNAFALDGQRLMLIEGEDGQTGAIYEMPIAQHNHISIISSANGTPETFQIKKTDGSTYKYGSSSGRFTLDNGQAYQWALDYAEDVLGNYIQYTYSQEGTTLYPTSITYGRNTHGTAGVDCTILFNYEGRPDPISTYFLDERYFLRKRLKSIVCKYNDNVYRTYTLNYYSTVSWDNYSYLSSITETGTSSSSYNPTTFDWGAAKLRAITDGIGATDSIMYASLREDGVYSVTDNYQHYRPNIMASNICVVKSHTKCIPTESKTTNYSYANGVEYYGDFLGFEDTKTIINTGNVTEIHNELENFEIGLLPGSVIQRDSIGNIINEEHNYTVIQVGNCSNHNCSYSIVNKSKEANYPFYKDEESWQFEDGFPRCQYIYDEIETRKDITYWQGENVWIKGLPQKIETCKEARWATDPILKYEETIYERDPATGLVLKETQKRDDKHIRTDEYTYNEYGQVTEHRTVVYNSTDTLVTRYLYNENGQLRKEFDSKGLNRVYSYNSSNGTLSLERDFDGKTIHYAYDDMLREKKHYTTAESCQTIRNFSDYGGSVYSIKEYVSGKTPVTTYYDAWGRKVAESSPLANGTVMYTDYHYLPNGEVGFVSYPHKITESTQEGTTYTYDSFLRKTSEVDSNGRTSTWEWDVEPRYDNMEPLWVRSCIDGVTREIAYITPDLVTRIIDPINGIDNQYDYNIDKNLASMWAGDDITYFYGSCEYDDYGRLVLVTDINGVTKQYTYDQNGYPLRTTIDGSYVETNYDKYGILRSKSWADAGETPHTVTYTYDDKFRLIKEEGDVYRKDFNYDLYGRVTYKRNMVGDNGTKGMTVNYEYNSTNQIKNAVYGLGKYIVGVNEIEEDFYYRNGYLSADTVDHVTIWSMKKQDRWGNVTEEKNRIGTTTRTYDDYGNILSMNRSGRYPISESYTYDVYTGNLTSKNDVSLTYEHPNRLKSWGDHTYNYDICGNIISQPLVGEFTYDGYKVDGMTAVDNYIIDDSLYISYYKAIGRPKSVENEHYKADFFYDGNGERVLMKVYWKGSGQYNPFLTRYYLDKNVEKTVDNRGNEFCFYYAGEDAYTAPAVMVFDKEASTKRIYQIIRDNQGSILQYEKDLGGRYQYSYSPWGVRTHDGDETNFYQPGEGSNDTFFYRTYKGHEDLWMFGLLNINNRLYSPYLGRFTSPDPLFKDTGDDVLDADLNPYAYSKNNPFKKAKKVDYNSWLK